MGDFCDNVENICSALKHSCNLNSKPEHGSKTVDKPQNPSDFWNEFGPFLYIVVLMSIFALIMLVLMLKEMVKEKKETDLGHVLAKMRDREREERQRLDRIRLLRTRNKVHRWLVYRNAPQKSSKQRESRRTSVSDFMTSIPNRLRLSDKSKRRASVVDTFPDIVVTEDVDAVRRKRFDTRWPTPLGSVEEFGSMGFADNENNSFGRISQQRNMDAGETENKSSRRMSQSPTSLSLWFDFDIDQQIDSDQEEGSSCSGYDTPTRLTVPKSIASSTTSKKLLEEKLKQRVKPKFPRVSSLQDDEY